ncbi:MAG: hypothetical protein U9N34_04900 [Candidatus Cloacimonadota bacterium]|nr:hypothetical protein [Candidatus Cloacimonadota bacterium]
MDWNNLFSTLEKFMKKTASGIEKITQSETVATAKRTTTTVAKYGVPAVTALGVGYVAYNTYKAIQFEKKLQALHKKHKTSQHNKYKREAKKVLTEVEELIEQYETSEDEKRESQNILNRYSSWVYSS